MISDNTLLDGRYRIHRQLAQGGMGAVYAATDERLRREVAVKVQHADAPELSERFLREAHAIARLTHPNIVAIFDVGQSGNDLYIVQELLRGESLAQLLQRRGHIALPRAVAWLLETSKALSYAHELGVVHRDVKPANIFLESSGSAKLVDFGIAKLADQENVTRAGFLVGTLGYASPEQIHGTEIDDRTDVYSLAAVAFEVVAGRRAFPSDDIFQQIKQVTQAPAPRLLDAAPHCPPELDDLVAQCLDRDRDRRPASMHEVAARLRGILDALGGQPDGEDVTRLSSGPTPEAAAPAIAAPATPVPHSGTMVGPVVAPPTRGDRTWPSLPLPPAPPTGVTNRTELLRRVDAPLTPGAAGGALAAGTRVGKWTVHELVARGQTGHLYKAFDPVRSRLIGLKVIERPTGLAVSRLLRASRIWLDLHHPNLQTILEVDPGETTGTALIATELIEGVDLGRLVMRRRLDLIQKIDVALQICDALDYMHARGIVHREIKPANIVLSEATLHVTVLDSGLARSADIDQSSLTRTGMVVGDLRYMAPEQTQGRYDQRSDIYALGVVLYELLMDEPFEAMQGRKMREHLQQTGRLPAKLVSCLLVALDDDPERRYGSSRELADRLRTLVPEKVAPVSLTSVVVTIHGIRTHASWQRQFSEVASRSGLHCRLDRWNFGYFSLFRFVAPWSRQARVSWFRATYHDEFGDQATSPLSSERPSIVAHSFGTYILGNALLRYPYLRFNKVLLCGSILPESFPWDVLIDRGQVQAVRNEYGARDVWTKVARAFVPGTGPSGLVGFSCQHERLEQEAFDYSHSEYFERGHMEDKWVPFIKRRLNHITPRERPVSAPVGAVPVGLYGLYAAAVLAAGLIAAWSF